MANSTTNTGVGFNGVLLILFITLKLTKVITWSWWWVLSPAWIPICFIILIFTIVGGSLFIKDKCSNNV